jgi:hypothetical protein
VFAATALHQHPEARRRIGAGDKEYLDHFVQEVRRLSPFFAIIGGRVRRPFEWRGSLLRQWHVGAPRPLRHESRPAELGGPCGVPPRPVSGKGAEPIRVCTAGRRRCRCYSPMPR